MVTPELLKKYRGKSIAYLEDKFLEFLGFNPEDKFVKGEELQEKNSRSLCE